MYNETEPTSIGQLIQYMNIRENGVQNKEDEEIVDQIERGGPTALYEDQAKKHLQELSGGLPIQIDKETACQIGSLIGTQYEKLYYLILDDIKNAYEVINAQIGSSIPNWTETFFLDDIRVGMIGDDDVWQDYVYKNEIENLIRPGCFSVAVPICLRFGKRESKQRYLMGIQFYDILCWLPKRNQVNRTYILNTKYIGNTRIGE